VRHCNIFSFYFLDWTIPGSSTVFLNLPTFNTSTTPSHTAAGSIATAATFPLLQVNVQQSPPYPQTIPPKVVKKILSLEYIDMAELLPKYWDYDEPESHCCGSHSTRTTRRSPVSNILIWLDFCALLVAVLCSVHPNKVGEFMPYQKTIISAYQKYAGDGWIIYNSSFRRQLEITGLGPNGWEVGQQDIHRQSHRHYSV